MLKEHNGPLGSGRKFLEDYSGPLGSGREFLEDYSGPLGSGREFLEDYSGPLGSGREFLEKYSENRVIPPTAVPPCGANCSRIIVFAKTGARIARIL